jgi:hypothetical protein
MRFMHIACVHPISVTSEPNVWPVRKILTGKHQHLPFFFGSKDVLIIIITSKENLINQGLCVHSTDKSVHSTDKSLFFKTHVHHWLCLLFIRILVLSLTQLVTKMSKETLINITCIFSYQFIANTLLISSHCSINPTCVSHNIHTTNQLHWAEFFFRS